ncbi:hypothetical protein C8Q80DRAFT_1341413 [Daedaleopsis nitida]|nr:hypothetical protein C8Q80DRAFT_1341413 [Daedaleopsis nitida]
MSIKLGVHSSSPLLHRSVRRATAEQDGSLLTPTADLIAFVFETVLWGAFINLFFLSIVQLRRRSRVTKNDIVFPTIFANSLLFALCTAHIALRFSHFYALYASMSNQNIYQAENNALYDPDALVTLCNFLGICALLHKCWSLWGQNYLTIVPASVCALLGFGCTDLARRAASSALVSEQAAPMLRISGHSLLMYANLMATIFTACRMSEPPRSTLPTWAAAAPSSASAEARPGVVAIAQESGLVHLVAQTVLFGFVATGHPAKSAVGGVVVQIYGLVPTLVAMRLGFGTDAGAKASETTMRTREEVA